MRHSDKHEPMDISTFSDIEPETETERTERHATLAVEVAVAWRSEAACHTDCHFAGKLNLWRDILPPPLEAGLLDRPVGYVLQAGFAPGDLLEPYQPSRLMTLRDAQFDRRLPRAGLIQPRAGRFYPKGVLRNVAGIYSENRSPFRVAEVEDGRLRADLNHPLADRDEEVARVLSPGGRLVVSFSNRRFPPKVVRVWEDIHELERPGLVLEYFLRSGRFRNLETYSLRGLPRPGDDPYARQTPFSDPVFAVWGEAA